MPDVLKVSIVRLQPMRVAYLRHMGPYNEVGPVFGKLMGWAVSRGAVRTGARMIGASWDDPATVPTALLRYDCCIEVDNVFKPVDDILVQTLAGGDYATYRHVGPYSGISDAFRRIFQAWLPGSGRQTRGGACLEVYGDQDHAATLPKDLVTDLYVPLR